MGKCLALGVVCHCLVIMDVCVCVYVHACSLWHYVSLVAVIVSVVSVPVFQNSICHWKMADSRCSVLKPCLGVNVLVELARLLYMNVEVVVGQF